MNVSVVCSQARIALGMLVTFLAVAWVQCSAQPRSADSHEPRNEVSLNGRVITSSQSYQRDARIELRSMIGQAVCSAYTDTSGAFHCPDVAPGRYQLTVSAGVDEQTIDISDASFNPEVTVRLADREPNEGQNKAVSVSEFKVPTKARKAFEIIIVRSKNGRLVEQAPTLLEGDAVEPSDARVIFVSQHGRYDLAKIWGAQGKRILTHVTEQNLGEIREVRIIHIPVSSPAKETR